MSSDNSADRSNPPCDERWGGAGPEPALRDTCSHSCSAEQPAHWRRVQGGWGSLRPFGRRHYGKAVFGLLLISSVMTVANNPLEDIESGIQAAAPWAAPGIALSEAGFICGAAMMASAVGASLGNPLKLKARISQIASAANNSLLFRVGFWINTIGALGTAIVTSVAIVSEMPLEFYGALPIAFIDIAVTIVVRKAMLLAIQAAIGHGRGD